MRHFWASGLAGMGMLLVWWTFQRPPAVVCPPALTCPVPVRPLPCPACTPPPPCPVVSDTPCPPVPVDTPPAASAVWNASALCTPDTWVTPGPERPHLVSLARWQQAWLQHKGSNGSVAAFCPPPYLYAAVSWAKQVRDVPMPATSLHMCTWPAKDDVHVSGSLQRGQLWEGHVASRFLRLLYAQRAQSNVSWVVDVGANIGQYTLLAALLGFRVVAVEPRPDHIEMMARTLLMNGVAERVLLFENAVGAVPGAATLHLYKTNRGGSTLFTFPGDAAERIGMLDVDVVTLDTLLQPHLDGPVLLWKLDIQGSEPRALVGAETIMQGSWAPKHLMLEYAGPMFSVTGCRCLPFFTGLWQLGYRVEDIKVASVARFTAFCGSAAAGRTEMDMWATHYRV